MTSPSDDLVSPASRAVATIHRHGGATELPVCVPCVWRCDLTPSETLTCVLVCVSVCLCVCRVSAGGGTLALAMTTALATALRSQNPLRDLSPHLRAHRRQKSRLSATPLATSSCQP